MREEFLALFRDTEHPLPLPPRKLSTEGETGLTVTQPSRFLRRFLQPAPRSPELVPSGLTDLDERLAGGFGPGLHLVLGLPGVGKTAFLESVAWETISSERPVLYYALRDGGQRAWERLISTLGYVLGGPVVPLDALRARRLATHDLETLTRLDLALQASVLPYLSLVETVPAHTDRLSALIEDIRLRAQEISERQGKVPVLFIDDMERLLPLVHARALPALLSRLDDALAADSIPGLLAVTSPYPSPCAPERLPVRTTLTLVPVSATANGAPKRVDLELRTNAHTGCAETLPLLLDRRSGLFTDSSTDTERQPL